MKRLSSREEDLNEEGVNVASKGSHMFWLSEAKKSAADGRADIGSILKYVDWVLDRTNTSHGSFRYACFLEGLSPYDEAQDIITRLIEGVNKKRLEIHMGDNFHLFISDLGERFSSCRRDMDDPLN